MKKILFCTVGAVAIAFTAPAFATTTTFLDTTQDFAYSGSGPSGYNGFGFTGSAPSTGDYLGDGFDTQKLVVTQTPGQIEFQYFTSFDGNDVGARYADIFLAPTTNLDQPPSAWTLGISLGLATNNFQGAVAAGLYSLASPADYETSQDVWGPLGTGWIYGGGYVAPDGSHNLSPTRVTRGTALSGWSVTSTVKPSGDAGYPYVVDVVLSAAPGTYDALFAAPDLDIFWGTGDCSNDALFAALDAPAGVPEPMTLSLFAAGLFGTIAMRRRKTIRA